MDKFVRDLEEFYQLVSKRDKELGELYRIVEDENYSNQRVEKYINGFLDKFGLQNSKEIVLALLTRLVGLRDEQLIQTLNKENKNEEEIQEIVSYSYIWSRDFHIKRFQEFIDEVVSKKLLNGFYVELLKGVHKTGVAISKWQYQWHRYIIQILNSSLKLKYKDNVISFLRKNSLFETDKNGNFTDRSYTVLTENNGRYMMVAYAEFFKENVDEVVCELDNLIKMLEKEEDEDTRQKGVYIDYFKALKDAFGEKEIKNLLLRWQEVDRRWMKVTSPLQTGHPLEYYEDHYRKSVALEWDLRVSNPKNLGANDTYNSILFMFKKLFVEVGEGKESILQRVIENLQRVQLYIGRPALYYGAEFNGLFSAQVVPNDETVTKEEGKKIFAFADNVLDSQRAKPSLKLERVVFGNDFVKEYRDFIFGDEDIWHKVYETSTIGHEFGHMLWLDNDSEVVMNKSGVFKNIEEFKATTGGLVAFFMNESNEIKKYILLDLIKRSVGLIAWMKTGEVEPYYCEGLIHLNGLFDSGVLYFENRLKIDMSTEVYEKLKQWYIKTYRKLALCYLEKKDAKEFLDMFTCKENDVYMPKEKMVYDFVKYYWSLYQDIGREIDTL